MPSINRSHRDLMEWERMNDEEENWEFERLLDEVDAFFEDPLFGGWPIV